MESDDVCVIFCNSPVIPFSTCNKQHMLRVQPSNLCLACRKNRNIQSHTLDALQCHEMSNAWLM